MDPASGSRQNRHRTRGAGAGEQAKARTRAPLRRHGGGTAWRTSATISPSIALRLKNGLDWIAIDLAALGLGLVVVPLYVDDNPVNVVWCIGNAEVKLLVLDNSRMAEALTRTGSALPEPTLATICYTSGTSGRPKGVMLSHGNIIANVRSCQQTGMAHASDVFLSILPLSHMFERTGGYYLPLSIGAKVVYARGVAQIAEDLASQAPTLMFAVPRIFEKFKGRIDQTLSESV